MARVAPWFALDATATGIWLGFSDVIWTSDVLENNADADYRLRLHTPLGPDVLVAETLDGRESVDGGGFRFEVGALSANAGLPL
ncbi:hypothetical protein, partial [Xanthomonas bromi]|uniref:hypothetical protein n=1 Tax=Xanthomonas bromi TaxID=56449 RepID=UPI0015E2A427